MQLPFASPMSIRSRAFVIAGWLIAGCASAPKYPVLGDWLVSSYTAPDVGVPALDQLAMVGASLTLDAGQVRFGELRCSEPTYTARPMTRAEFTAQFKVDPASLQLTADPIQAYEVACEASGPLGTRLFIVRDADTILVPSDGIFYELTRRAVR